MARIREILGVLVCAAGVAAILVALAAPSGASGSKLHLLVPSVASFASDGARYVAWEVPGEKGIFVLDTRTHRRVEMVAPCPLENKAPASAGRFLLGCGEEEEALLDVHTGVTTMLPKSRPPLYGGFGPVWTGVGSRYVIGRGATAVRCQGPRPSDIEGCVVLYNIASRAMTEVAESLVRDPGRAGAQPLCPALRGRVLKLSKFENLEGFGPLTPLETDFSYGERAVAEPEGLIKGEIAEPLTHLLVFSCSGATTVVPAHPERGNLVPYGMNLVLGDGILTWDTGHASELYEREEIEPENGTFEHGRLSSYNLRTRLQRSWPLPILPMTVTEGEAHPQLRKRVSGTFGYSTHTSYDVLWVAQRSFNVTCYEICEPDGLGVSSVYASRNR